MYSHTLLQVIPFNATKHIWASIHLRMKWNIGRILIFDFAIRKALSTRQKLWYAV